MAELQAKVGYLSDRQQIHDVYLRYMRAFDRNDVGMLKTAFWPDVQINYGGQMNTFDEFIDRHLTPQLERHSNWGHLITNEFVEIDDDMAHVESYVTQLISGKTGKSMIVGGRYIDRLDRRNGEWRIAVRETIIYFFTETNTALDQYIKAEKWSGSACGMGTRDKRDPSYQRPLTARPYKNAGPACAELNP